MVKPGSRCFDIGGREGYDPLMMAKRSKSEVVTFECCQTAAEEMRQTFQFNPNLHIRVIQAYVGANDGDRLLTIDKASRDLFPPDFIKLDIEGAEAEALLGAKETLATHRPALIIEVHGADREESCLSILRGVDYAVTIVKQANFLRDSARVGHNRWLAAYPAQLD